MNVAALRGENTYNFWNPSDNSERVFRVVECASPRYIFTNSHRWLVLCSESDDPLLECQDDGDRIEPQFYVPIIPFMLINGTRYRHGWSTAIPPHHPVEVVDAVKARILKGEETKDRPLMPWFKGFEGNVKKSSTGVFRFEGNVSHNRLKVNIKELPPRVWTQQYKETLSSMVRGVRARIARILIMSLTSALECKYSTRASRSNTGTGRFHQQFHGGSFGSYSILHTQCVSRSVEESASQEGRSFGFASIEIEHVDFKHALCECRDESSAELRLHRVSDGRVHAVTI